MIVFDTETTDLVGPSSLPVTAQPAIVEFAAVKLRDEDLTVRSELHFLCCPKKPISAGAVKTSKITDAMVADLPPFAAHLRAVTEFFLGERVLLAHNIMFDVSMLTFELERLGKVTQFPWPPLQLCSVDLTFHLQGRRLKQEELYVVAMGRPAQQTHRAPEDVGQLVEIVRWLQQQQLLPCLFGPG